MLNEFYLRNKMLISKPEWERKILSIKDSVAEDLQDKEKAKTALTNELLRAVRERLPDEPFGVLFSGGVDSSLIALLAKRAGKDFTCYTFGFQENDSKEPEDIMSATVAAQELGLKIKTIIFDLEKAQELIRKTAKILGSELNNVVNVGVGGVVLGCIELAKKDGVRYLFSGLGSEELFAGYQRHKLAKDRQAECWQGLLNMHERDLLRDAAISSATKTNLLTPFLDEKLIATAMRVPAKFKINNDESKLILREIAEGLRLPKDITWRGKRAAQYGSRLDKAIDKLARKNGFKLKKDYLMSLN
jgi:asparagine synthase (glutamine-hydrolysing)